MNNLILGDCLEVMPKISDKSVDLIIADLPYGITNNPWDSVLPIDRLWPEFLRIAKDAAPICLFADGLFMAKLMTSQPSIWKYNLVWDKVLTSGFLNANRRPLRQHEEICIFYRKQPVYNPQMVEGKPNHSKGHKTTFANRNYGRYNVIDNGPSDLKYPTSILRFQKTHPSKSLHPTEKSLELCQWLVRTYSNPGDTVFDCCMGSGTTGVAAVLSGRKFVGIEKDPIYFESAKARIISATSSEEKGGYTHENHGSKCNAYTCTI